MPVMFTLVFNDSLLCRSVLHGEVEIKFAVALLYAE